MVLLFWGSAVAIAYVFAGYPLMLAAWARLRPRPLAAARPGHDVPGVSIVIAARNEGARLASRIDNLLAIRYPPSRRQIIVVSDGSTDDTVAVLGRYGSAVDVLDLPAGGKAVALNAGVARARFNLLVFADARQVFADDALVELTWPFEDPAVGAVTGELLLLESESNGRRTATADRRGVGPAEPRQRGGDKRAGFDRRQVFRSTIAEGFGLYWRYEKRMRRLESAIGSTLGATGAIYAMRRSLWTPLPADTVLDDVLAPMRAVLAGYRIVFNDRARAFDRTSSDGPAEARRKVRTLAGNYQILAQEPRLLLPWRNPVWLQYLSHKIARLLVPYALLLLFVSSVALAGRGLFYAVALAAQGLFYALAVYGAWLDRQPSVTERPASGSPWPARPQTNRESSHA